MHSEAEESFRKECKTAVFHDYFAICGGGERLVLMLAEAINDVTLIYGYRTGTSYDDTMFPQKRHSLGLSPFIHRFGLHLPALTLAFALYQKRAKSYSIRIFSGVTAPFSAPPLDADSLNVFYCHTPPRFLYDQREHFMKGASRVKRLVASMFEVLYRRTLSRMDVIVTNSENTQRRIRKYLGRDSIIVYPPVNTNRFNWRGQGDYYLSTGRLTPLKRVDRIVEAFMEMPDKKLIIASGGEELEHLQSIAAGASNIEFRGWVCDTDLLDLVGNAIATIYLPTDEDFGMSPVESMSAGKPVIGVAEGGLLETIVPEETGILLGPAFTRQDLIDAVRKIDPEKAMSMRSACEERANLFSTERFIEGMKRVIDQEYQKKVGI